MGSPATELTNDARYRHPNVADVILCRERDKGSSWIIRTQRLVRRRKVHFSHVAFYLNGYVLHAVPGAGVDVEDRVSFFLNPDLGPNWRVFRHRVAESLQAVYEDMSPEGEKARMWFASIERIAGFYLTQGYNWKFGMPKASFWRRSRAHVDPSSFCSELIAKILLVLRLVTGFEHRNPTWVFPADLENAVLKSGHWIEVTDLYRDWLSRLQKYPAAIEGEREFQRQSAARFRNMTLLLGKHAEQTIEDAGFVEGVWRLDQLFKEFGQALLRAHSDQISRNDRLLKAMRDVLSPPGGTPVALDFDSVVKDLGGLRWTSLQAIIRARMQLAQLTRWGRH